MNNILKTLLIFIFLANCSFNQNSKFWTNNKIKSAEIKETKKLKEIFKKKIANNLEFNPTLKINLNPKIENIFYDNLANNKGRVNYNGNFSNISKFKLRGAPPLDSLKVLEELKLNILLHILLKLVRNLTLTDN